MKKIIALSLLTLLISCSSSSKTTFKIDYEMFELDNVKLTFNKEAILTLAKEAIKRKTGARGLRSIIENSMLDLMYEIPGTNDIESVKITRGAVQGKSKPVIRRKPKQAAA